MSAEKQLLISFANWVTENDIKNLRPEQLAEFYLEEHAKQSKQEEDNELRMAAEKVVDYALYGGIGVDLHAAITELEKALK